MKKIILYSDQMIEENKKVDIELLKILNSNNVAIGYVPSSTEPTRKYFNQKIEYYSKLGINNIQYFDIDMEYNESNFKDIFKCDAIHLSGGNTFYFLKLLRERNLIRPIKTYVENGGILIGVSAGSIIATKTIDIANYCDEDNTGEVDRDALGLVDFEFMPHWNENVKYLEQLKEYSKLKGNTIFGCKDGDGIVVIGDDIKLIGNIVKV